MSKAKSQADSIFCSVIEMASAEERAAYLDQACGEDVALRRHLEKLLDAHFRAGSFLEGPGPALPTTIDQPITEGAGTVIGPYKLLKQIGVGGFGIVFMAEQREPVRRKVALKVIKPGMDTHQVIARFEAERQALALMDHPNIARVLDAGATDSGRPYFVMELVKGLPITDFCDQHQFTPRQRLELFVHVCQAVQHAHQKGIIHRDIKPSNVLVTEHDGTPVVKVIDFGIAKATGQQLTDKTLFTNFAQMVGTPLYMSPEQAGMSALDIDTRSDIYSLGVLLYELLTGSTPFDKERLRGASYDEIRRIIREEEPAKPSTRISTLGQAGSTVSAQRQSDPRRLRQLLRGDLDWIVMRALEKDRTHRYETANDLARDVARHLHDEPVQARPPSAGYLLRKFARRNKRALGLTASVLTTLGLAGGSWLWVRHLESTHAAEINERTAQSERDRAIQEATTKQRVDDTLNRANELIHKRNWPEAMALATRAEGILESGGGSPELQRRVRELQGELQMVARLEEIRLQKSDVKDGYFDFAQAAVNYAKAFREYGIDVPALDTQEAADRIRARGIRVELAVALEDWAREVRPRDRKDGTWKQLLAVARAADPDSGRNEVRDAWVRGDRQALEQLAASDRVRTLPPSTLLLLGNALAEQDSLEKAVALLRTARQHHPGDFWINHWLGFYLSHMTPPDTDEAIRYYTAAVSLRQSPGAYLNLGVALVARGSVDEAIAAYREAIRLKPDYAMAYNNLGKTLSEQNNKLDDASAAFREVIKLDPKRAHGYYNLGIVLQKQGKLDDAIAAFRQAVKVDTNFALGYYNLGSALSRQKSKLDDAIAAYQKSIDIDPRYAAAYNNLGIVLEKQGKVDDAITAYQKAIDNDPKNAAYYHNLGLAFMGRNKFDKAIEAYRMTIRLNPDNAEDYCNLGLCLKDLGYFTEALAAFRRGHDLGSPMQGWSYPSAQWIRNCERLVALDQKLTEVLRGEAKVEDAADHIAFAHMCQEKARQLYGTSVRFYEVAFGAQPELETQLRMPSSTRPWPSTKGYNAACAAALAGDGQGKDEPAPDEQARARYRKQALGWLRADLLRLAKPLENPTTAVRTRARQTLEHWKRDSALASLRDAVPLANLSEVDREACRGLWLEVESLLQQSRKDDQP